MATFTVNRCKGLAGSCPEVMGCVVSRELDNIPCEVSARMSCQAPREWECEVATPPRNAHNTLCALAARRGTGACHEIGARAGAPVCRIMLRTATCNPSEEPVDE